MCRSVLGFFLTLAVLCCGTRSEAGDVSPCLQTQFTSAGMGAANCVSKDVQVTALKLISVVDGCTGPSDTATVDVEMQIKTTATNRYDPAFWIATDGGNALTGGCYKEYLPPPLSTTPAAANLASGYGPYLNSDADSCGDMRSSDGTEIRRVSTSSDIQTYQNLVLKCSDLVDATGAANPDGKLDVAYCAGWDSSSNSGNCPNMAAAIPTLTNKCNCTRLNLGVNISVSVPAADPLDFGDAPSPYPTTLANSGARHTMIGTGPRLGGCVDSETDGQPNSTATGDDLAVGATVAGTCPSTHEDEDGVTIPPLRVGQNATVQVVATAACTLSAFIDFNRDGDWADSGEDLFPSGQALVAGTNSLTVAVPAGASPGTSFARFRCTTAGKVTYTGLANDGEVEDYAVTIIPANAGSLSVVKKVMLAGGACGVNDVAPTLTVFAGQRVEYCYYVTAQGGTVYDVSLVDDMGTADAGDDQTITLSGLTNIGGNPSKGDLAASATATGKSTPVQF